MRENIVYEYAISKKYKTSTCDLILDVLDLVKIKSNGYFLHTMPFHAP